MRGVSAGCHGSGAVAVVVMVMLPPLLQVEDIDLSKNTLFLRMMPRIDYNRKRGSLRSVSGWGGEGREEGRGGGKGRTGGEVRGGRKGGEVGKGKREGR